MAAVFRFGLTINSLTCWAAIGSNPVVGLADFYSSQTFRALLKNFGGARMYEWDP